MEFLDVVNDKDEIIGRETRAVIHQKGLQHRGAHIFLFNESGEMLVQKRSPNRAAAPSLLDCSVSEHVQSGEDYFEAAIRGLREEMGIDHAGLEKIAKFKLKYGPNDNEISVLYAIHMQNPQITFDPEEISEVFYLSMDEIRRQMKEKPHLFCGWFVQILNWYFGEASDLIILETNRRHAAS